MADFEYLLEQMKGTIGYQIGAGEAQAAMAARIIELESKLEAQRIDHPTDICECRFDFSDGVMKVRKQCAYHKGIADRLNDALKEIEQWRKHAEERADTHELEVRNLRAENEALRTRNDLLANRAYPPERDWGL